MTDFPETGRLAGIDYGTVRIGVAVSDPGRRVASPYETYARRGEESDAGYFRQLVSKENIVGFVVGLPLHASGEESEKSREARVFSDWLSTVTKIPVRFHDERYTTREATNLLGAARMSKKKRKRRLDMLAAQLLLSAYLESSRHDIPPGRLDD
ncbi:MAG: Holliday junction resolvase RuvX [Pirellulaceae bacterium]